MKIPEQHLGVWLHDFYRVLHTVTLLVFFFQAEDGIRDYKVTGVQTCALPIFGRRLTKASRALSSAVQGVGDTGVYVAPRLTLPAELRDLSAELTTTHERLAQADRKSTRLNSSHLVISYAVFCLKKKKKTKTIIIPRSIMLVESAIIRIRLIR